MVAFRSLWVLLPRPIREVPADLAAVAALAVATNVATFAPVVRETPIRIPLGLVFVLFVPGYAFVAALFPSAGEPPTASADAKSEGDEPHPGSRTRPITSLGIDASSIDGLERAAFSCGFSIALVPLIGLLLNATPWGIGLTPIVVAVSGFTIVMSAIAAGRRQALPPEERFRVPFRGWYTAVRTELLEPDTRAEGVLNVLLVASVLLAASTGGYAMLAPSESDQFSAIYLLTEDDDGELVAEGYPSEFVRGESREVIVGVDNREHETTEYTVVVIEQDVRITNETATSPEDGNVTYHDTAVTDQRELDRFSTTLAHNESWQYEYELEPTVVGENQRVVWLLFPGGDSEIPADPSIEDTEYHGHLWINVTDSDTRE